MTTITLGNRGTATIGLYVDSACGVCGYGLLEEKAVALASSEAVRNGEALCLRCLAELLGDLGSATHGE